MKIGLTDEDFEKLENGETIEFVYEGRVAGRNATLGIELADLDNCGQYHNVETLMDYKNAVNEGEGE